MTTTTYSYFANLAVGLRVVALAGLLLVAGQSLLQDPNVANAIQPLLQPKLVPYYVIAIGLITELARRRTV